jgi:hypothetical protein
MWDGQTCINIGVVVRLYTVLYFCIFDTWYTGKDTTLFIVVPTVRLQYVRRMKCLF